MRSVPKRGHVDPPVPGRAGVGLKPQHYDDILRENPDLGFFEIHAENYMCDGGPPHRYLEAIRASYPLSIHGVALSIGGASPPDEAHLARLAALVRRYEPGLVSEHLAWSTHDGAFLSDLLPLPYTEGTLHRVCAHVDRLQAVLGRSILVENPSTYVRFRESSLAETDFLKEMAARTGCGLLLDVNNVLVSAVNHGFDPHAYLARFPMAHVAEIHLAGHAETLDGVGAPLLIDAHGTPVAEPVWSLYDTVLERTGPLPTLIERDNEVPSWSVLAAEALRVEARLRRAHIHAGETIHAA
ncbi:MAG: DUF692 family multinuclear iron-containing protein [Alphaproteobacteria bacterium]